MMKNIVINVGQENKGLNVSIGYILAEEYGNNVKFIVENIFAEKEVKALYPAANVVNFSSLNCDIEEDKVVDTALDIESSYNIKFSSIMASTRDFGRGYLVNIGNFPNIGRSNWDYKKKLSYVISETLKWVEILHGQDIYMQKWIGRIPSFVAKKYGVKTLSLVPVKYGDRFMWSDNSYNTSKAFIDAIKKNRSEVVNNKFFLEEENNFILEGTTKLLNSRIKYTYLYAFKRTYQMVLNEVKKIILGTKKYGGYSYFSWIPTVFYSVNNYNFLRKIGVEPKEIKEYKVVYFPLHLEPEQSLLSLSPEFGNITEAIHLISKNLPCDYVLVLKEQPFCFAVRDKIFYRQMSQIGNIFFAKPEISSHRWINAADIVIAITGTVGIEAIYENKFVLSFGKHQIINYLPSVHYVRNYSEVSDAIRGILNSRVDSDVLSQSKKIIKKSQFEVSFTLKEYKYSIHDSSLCIDLAMKTIENLMITHRDIFI